MGGWEPFGPVRTITRAEGNVLYELDGHSALDLYKTYLGDHASAVAQRRVLLFPIVVTEPEGGQGVSSGPVLAVDEQQKSMTFAGDIPQGGTAQLMKTNVDDLVDGATAAAEASLRGLGGAAAGAGASGELRRPQAGDEAAHGGGGRGDPRHLRGGHEDNRVLLVRRALARSARASECRLHNQTMTMTALAEV